MQQRRQSKSPSFIKCKRVPSPSKRMPCTLCKLSVLTTLHLQRSLYRKYSSSQNHHYLTHFNSIQQKLQLSTSTADEQVEQYLGRYHRGSSRRVLFTKIKQTYKIYREMPRIFHSLFKNLLDKCHHRKRLLEYYKIAKGMGLRLDSVDFSSFLLSIHFAEEGCNNFKRVLEESWTQA